MSTYSYSRTTGYNPNYTRKKEEQSKKHYSRQYQKPGLQPSTAENIGFLGMGNFTNTTK